MNKIDIIKKVELAIYILFTNDFWLLQNDLSEKSITHKLAEYLQHLFLNYNVDCEYNGNIERGKNGRKRINVLKQELFKKGLLKEKENNEIDSDYTDRQVFPDIIIHERGTNKNNLCIVEVKKSTSRVPFDYDEIKLQAYTTDYYGNDLKYKIGLFIEFKTATPVLDFNMKIFINGIETILE